MWETNYAERLNYLNPLLFFSFKKLNDANSSSFIRFDWILHDSAVLFSYFENFLKFKRGGPSFLGETNSAERLNYLILPSVFQFQKVELPKFFVIH